MAFLAGQVHGRQVGQAFDERVFGLVDEGVAVGQEGHALHLVTLAYYVDGRGGASLAGDHYEQGLMVAAFQQPPHAVDGPYLV
jgi:hypothetical protein